jgi:hypothetical protein
MKKNFGDIFAPIESDPINGQYFITIPEQIVNELDWYEDMQIKFTIDGNELILSEMN